MSPTQEVAGRLVEARRYVGLSQEFVAGRLGIHRSALSDIERARRRVDAEELRQLAKLYGCSIDSLLTGEAAELPSEVQSLARTIGALTPEDRAEVVRFAQFLRTRSPRRSDPT